MQVLIKHTVVSVAKGTFSGILRGTLRVILTVMCVLLVTACGSETPERTQPKSNDNTVDPAAGTVVLMKTSLGVIELSLDAEKAPLSVENFLAYADSGHYDGTVFHRVIAGFMVQGGGFDADLQQKATRDPIQNEATNGLKNVKYSIAMARTQVWDSATAQFFINVADNAFLDEQYAVFGHVVAGIDVVDSIAEVQTGASGRFQSDVPMEPIIIEGVSRK